MSFHPGGPDFDLRVLLLFAIAMFVIAIGVAAIVDELTKGLV